MQHRLWALEIRKIRLSQIGRLNTISRPLSRRVIPAWNDTPDLLPYLSYVKSYGRLYSLIYLPGATQRSDRIFWMNDGITGSTFTDGNQLVEIQKTVLNTTFSRLFWDVRQRKIRSFTQPCNHRWTLAPWRHGLMATSHRSSIILRGSPSLRPSVSCPHRRIMWHPVQRIGLSRLRGWFLVTYLLSTYLPIYLSPSHHLYICMLYVCMYVYVC
jgi:hypothetical protein